MLPMAISALPFLAAMTEVKSSGRDVPDRLFRYTHDITLCE
jgi:hypothetical protein